MEPGISDVPLLLSLAQGRVSCLALLALERGWALLVLQGLFWASGLGDMLLLLLLAREC